jgi:hypothetical protein
MSDRFPSISPDGLRIAASALPRGGQAVQFVGDASGEWQPVPVEFDASGGVWLTSTDLLFTRNKPRGAQDGAILRWDGRIIDLYHDPGLEGWSCHNGHFAGWRRGDRLKSITLSRDGHVAGTVDLGDGRNVALEVDGVEIDRGPIAEPRYTGEALVWVKYVDGVRRIRGRAHHGARTEDLSWPFPDDEFFPQVIETPLGRMVLTHGHPEKGRPLWLRPWAEGQTHGYIVARGITDRPDARAVNGGVLVAYSNLVALQRVVVNLAAPLVDPVAPPSPIEPVDPPKETPVQLESKHSQLIEAFAARFPPPGGDEDALRDHWTPKLIEQFVFSFPNEGWCWKSTNPGGRPSSDVIARQVSGGMWGYDLIPGAGTSGWRLESHPGPIDLRTQAPIRMNPVNHLGATTPTPGPSPTQPPVTPPTSGRPIPEAYMPWDVQVDVLTRFIAGIWPKDRVPEVTETGLTGSGTLSRGALGFLIPIQFKTTIAWMNANGGRAPVGMEWWTVAEQAVAASVAEYRRSQPTP